MRENSEEDGFPGLLSILTESEEDEMCGRVSPIAETFGKLRELLAERK